MGARDLMKKINKVNYKILEMSVNSDGVRGKEEEGERRCGR